MMGLPVTGFDRLSAGTGQMRWRVAGLVPVMTVDGPDITRSAAGRLVAEIALVPSAFRVVARTAGAHRDSGWWWGTDRQESGEFFRARITGAAFR